MIIVIFKNVILAGSKKSGLIQRSARFWLVARGMLNLRSKCPGREVSGEKEIESKMSKNGNNLKIEVAGLVKPD